METENRNNVCSYGTTCNRRNKVHFEQISHPHLDNILKDINPGDAIILPAQLNFDCKNRSLLLEQLETLRTVKREKCANSHRVILERMRECGENPAYVPEPGNFALKYVLAAPYYIFFTAVQKSAPTWHQPLSVTLSELLDKSLGDIVSSVHFTFVVDIGWMCTQYLLAGQKRDMLIFYGERADESSLPPNIQTHVIKCPTSFGCHHSKISILQYSDGGIRIIVSTANLYKDDWQLRTQGIWMSPHLPRLPETAKPEDGESKTGFKADFLNYLSKYGSPIKNWESIVSKADFSSVEVLFLASYPGNYNTPAIKSKWGHRKLRTILEEHVEIPESESPTTIITQSSSIGSLGGKFENSWISSNIIDSMSKCAHPLGRPIPDFKFIFPTIDDYKNSYDMREAANCLCYNVELHSKQDWIARYMHKWRAAGTDRTKAVPHIKSYTRISADQKKIFWFVLGSANLSKAAWGYNRGNTYCILNYEASVVFIPKFINGGTSFPLKGDSSGTPIFPIPYDLPLTPYTESDSPFVTNFFNSA